MFQQPSPFNRFIANSPSVFYDSLLISKIEKEYTAKTHELKAKLFISSGNYEEDNDPPFYKNFVAQLKASNYNGLEMESLLVDKTGHGSAGFYALIRGMEFIYNKPDITVDTTLLSHYAGHYEFSTQLLNKNDALYFSGNGIERRLSAETDKRFYLKGVNE